MVIPFTFVKKSGMISHHHDTMVADVPPCANLTSVNSFFVIFEGH